MKFYNLNTSFTFGKYQGKTVKEIAEIQPSYFDWCAINLEHFYISDEVVAEIREIKSDFILSKESQKKLSEKFQIWLNEQEDNNYPDHNDYNERHTYDRYSGSYAQDVEGWSDQDIDDVFDGNPDAYWNID